MTRAVLLVLLVAAPADWSARARAILAERDYAGAARYLEAALTSAPSDFALANLLGATLERAGEPERALRCYERALELRPRSGTARLNLALALVRLERYDRASQEFTRVLGEEPPEPIREPAFHQSPDDDVMRRFAAAVPARERDWYELGMLFLRHGRLRGAEAVLAAARERFPLSAALCYALGWCLQESGRFGEAVDALRRALELQEPYPEAALRLAYGHFVQGQYAEAVAGYARVLQSRSDSYEAHYFLALALEKRDAPALEAAIGHLVRAVELRPQSFDSRTELGRMYLAAGRRGDAERELELAARLEPAQEKAHFLLAQLYRQTSHGAAAEREQARFEELKRQTRERARTQMLDELRAGPDESSASLGARVSEFVERYRAALLAREYGKIWQWLTPASRRLYDDDPKQFARVAARVFERPEVAGRLRQATLTGGRRAAGRILCDFAAKAGEPLPPLVLVEEAGEWKVDFAFDWTTAGLGYLGTR